MCGIAGFVDFKHQSSKETLKEMTDVLNHRGPDDSGYFFKENMGFQTGLGHRRLSILDLSSHGHQPMTHDYLHIVYNGEIYNFGEIRLELERLGYCFTSNSDTEVIIKAYHKWGIDAVHRFNGMFAIAIFDSQQKTLTLIRDRVGVKPLYWYHKYDLFMFASELKSFHQHPNFTKELSQDGLSLFFQYGYIKKPNTIFENTYKLEPGHYLKLDLKTSQVTLTEYWDLKCSYQSEKLDISEDEAITETEKLMQSAFTSRMVSDVPVGVFLSGGYDSSAVASILQSSMTQKLRTFTIGFHEQRYNEATYAKRVADYLETEHTEYYCTQRDAASILPLLAEIYDEPFGDSSAIPTILVSKLAKRDVSVALSADGGDELFGGYNAYTNSIAQYKKLQKIPKLLKSSAQMFSENLPNRTLSSLMNVYNLEGKLNKFSELMRADCLGHVFDVNGKYFQLNEVNNLLNTEFKKNEDGSSENTLDELLYASFTSYLPEDILTKVDRATMSVSLEGREPFLDYRLVEFVAQLPENMKVKNGDKKYLLKEIVHKYLPKEMMERKKMGFSIPVFDWFKDELKEYIDHYLNDYRIQQAGILNVKLVKCLKRDFFNGRGNPHKLWLLLMFEMWRERWL